MTASRTTWVEIDLDALRHNLTLLRQRAGGAAVVGVVKADAYGHGASLVAETLLELGLERLAVATVDEALALRGDGIDAPIMVFSGVGAEQAAATWSARLEPVVFTEAVVDALEAQRPAGARPLGVHLQLDSGMGRLGCLVDEFGPLLARLRRCTALEPLSVMTHLARAEESDLTPTMAQLSLFEGATAAVRALPRHAANSAALAQIPEATYDWVRPGLALYGIEPLPHRPMGLRPVMRWRCRIAHTRSLPAGSPLGYGGRFVTERRTLVGVLPVGYADGYPWCAEGKAEVLIDGRRAPLLGAVSMDMVLVDLTDHGRVTDASAVTLLGQDGDDAIEAYDIARWGNRHVYEVVTGVGNRVERRPVRSEARP